MNHLQSSMWFQSIFFEPSILGFNPPRRRCERSDVNRHWAWALRGRTGDVVSRGPWPAVAMPPAVQEPVALAVSRAIGDRDFRARKP